MHVNLEETQKFQLHPLCVVESLGIVNENTQCPAKSRVTPVEWRREEGKRTYSFYQSNTEYNK